MKYISTRGDAPDLCFEEVVLAGLANDGGLYVPEKIPTFSQEEIASWTGLSYQDLTFKVISPFISGEIPSDDLKKLISISYSSFRHDAVAPLVQIGHNEWVLELFHGPTLAFKDFSLQFLGNLVDYLLKKKNKKAVIIGATSGDTGSAAIEGCKDCKSVDIFILHPYQRVSDIQRSQMTTVLDKNIHNIALKGNFDDCQNMVKSSFSDQSFLPENRQLVAVNSINWVRIMIQIVYYFYSGLALGAENRAISFSVPTGNFGDIFAGYIAKQMGLPIEQLVIATNTNDILHRCISNNDHSKKPLVSSLSPSMDIMLSSNFERLLFDLYDRNAIAIKDLMDKFKDGPMVLSDKALAKARTLFSTHCLDDDETVAVISEVFEKSTYLLDPHTAIGVQAARKTRKSEETPMICLATAHPAKFPDVAKKSGQTSVPKLPHHIKDLCDRDERYVILENDIMIVQKYVAKNIMS